MFTLAIISGLLGLTSSALLGGITLAEGSYRGTAAWAALSAFSILFLVWTFSLAKPAC